MARKQYYQDHKETIMTRSRNRYYAKREEILEKARADYRSTLKVRTRKITQATTWNKENKEQRNERMREYHRHLKMEVFLAYGGKCACCGESNFYFLTLDHVNNDGKQHRENVKTKMHVWARANGYPETLQVLCYNYNLGREHSDSHICPHREG